MKVSLSPINNYNKAVFKANDKSKSSASTVPTQRQIIDAKTKKAVSECFFVALGVAIFYMFAKVQGKTFSSMLKSKQTSTSSPLAQFIIEPVLPNLKDGAISNLV